MPFQGYYSSKFPSKNSLELSRGGDKFSPLVSINKGIRWSLLVSMLLGLAVTGECLAHDVSCRAKGSSRGRLVTLFDQRSFLARHFVPGTCVCGFAVGVRVRVNRSVQRAEQGGRGTALMAKHGF